MIAKPSRLERAVEKWKRHETSTAEKRRVKRLRDEAWAKVSAQVSVRDKQTCRVCGCQTTRFGSGNPVTWGVCHHLVFRSAGGSDDLSNLVWLCHSCHDGVHQHTLTLEGPEGQLKAQFSPRPLA